MRTGDNFFPRIIDLVAYKVYWSLRPYWYLGSMSSGQHQSAKPSPQPLMINIQLCKIFESIRRQKYINGLMQERHKSSACLH